MLLPLLMRAQAAAFPLSTPQLLGRLVWQPSPLLPPPPRLPHSPSAMLRCRPPHTLPHAAPLETRAGLVVPIGAGCHGAQCSPAGSLPFLSGLLTLALFPSRTLVHFITRRRD